MITFVWIRLPAHRQEGWSLQEGFIPMHKAEHHLLGWCRVFYYLFWSLMHRGMNALVWIVSYVLQLVTYSGLKEKVERERFSSKTGATAVASSVIDVRMTNVLVSVSQIVVLSLHWHTCQILMLQLHKLSYASIQTYINQNKKKKIHQLLLFFFIVIVPIKQIQLCVPVLPDTKEIKEHFLTFLFSYMLHLLPKEYLYSFSLWYSLTLPWNVIVKCLILENLLKSAGPLQKVTVIKD